MALFVATSGLGAGVMAAPAAAVSVPPDASGNYTFQTLNDNRDPTFNQLLGINDSGLISGYFGSGMAGHPNKVEGRELLLERFRVSAPSCIRLAGERVDVLIGACLHRSDDLAGDFLRLCLGRVDGGESESAP